MYNYSDRYLKIIWNVKLCRTDYPNHGPLAPEVVTTFTMGTLYYMEHSHLRMLEK